MSKQAAPSLPRVGAWPLHLITNLVGSRVEATCSRVVGPSWAVLVVGSASTDRRASIDSSVDDGSSDESVGISRLYRAPFRRGLSPSGVVECPCF